MDVFRSTWEAEQPELAKLEAGALYGSEASVYCIVCDAHSCTHPSGAAYFIRMPDGVVQYICLRCVSGGSARISDEFRKHAEQHRELMMEYERNAAAPVSLPPGLRRAAREELEARGE
jgi:hypothetical protein